MRKTNRTKKIAAIFLSVLLMITIFPVSISVSAASARLLDIDTTTRGDWVGNFGSEGFYIIGSVENLPSYATVEFFDADGDFPSAWTWWDSEFDDEPFEDWRIPSALIKAPDSPYRIASCYFTNFFTVDIDIGDQTRKVSLYLTDFDEGNREVEISVTDADGNTLMSPIEVIGYEDGWYLQFVMSGRVHFTFDLMFGPNAVISGIFFDPDPDAEEIVVEYEEEPTPSVVEQPTVEEYVASPPPPVEQAPPTPAPATADPITLIAAAAFVSAAGAMIAKRAKRRK